MHGACWSILPLAPKVRVPLRPSCADTHTPSQTSPRLFVLPARTPKARQRIRRREALCRMRTVCRTLAGALDMRPNSDTVID